jgi:hypothetical protein
MTEEYDILPRINRNDLSKAKKYTWIYLPLFISDVMRYNHREIMPKLNSSQQTLLTFYLFDASMCTCHCDLADNWRVKGGFLRLIYDGYGEYVFNMPFSKIIYTWGAKKISRIISKAKSKYEKHKGKVENVKTLKELSDLCSEINDFEKLDYEYMKNSVEETKKIKNYIDKNISKFAIIDEDNTQVSYIDLDIKEIEDRIKLFEEMEKENIIN